MNALPNFITLEGGEGSGKTTQSHILQEWITEKKGLDVLLTREPGGTDLGAEIRSLLVKNTTYPPVPLAELFLFMSDRAQHAYEKVIPHCEKPRGLVLSDRWHDSTVAYQGYGRELIEKFGQEMFDHAAAMLPCTPGKTFYLDTDPEIGLARARARNIENESQERRFDDEEMAFHQRTRTGFLELAKQHSGRITVIDANESIAYVQKQLREEIEYYLTGEGLI